MSRFAAFNVGALPQLSSARLELPAAGAGNPIEAVEVISLEFAAILQRLAIRATFNCRSRMTHRPSPNALSTVKAKTHGEKESCEKAIGRVEGVGHEREREPARSLEANGWRRQWSRRRQHDCGPSGVPSSAALPAHSSATPRRRGTRPIKRAAAAVQEAAATEHLANAVAATKTAAVKAASSATKLVGGKTAASKKGAKRTKKVKAVPKKATAKKVAKKSTVGNRSKKAALSRPAKKISKKSR
ncbi:hypothetical protein I41_49270 [Lacipirellula limnantheis]|uniref:Uncharacterized protein n=1 Tax=Lacipirellula limnantheis TaxID=2528024 RepID=A0A517U4X4_9BACT|nr:hypothetical protein I41_49270 [Lacipirellula limnantheis]